MKFNNEMENGMPESNNEELENRFYDTSYMHGRPHGEEPRHHAPRHDTLRHETPHHETPRHEAHKDVRDDFGFEIDEMEDNVMGLVHPSSEGKDTSHKSTPTDLEMIQD